MASARALLARLFVCICARVARAEYTCSLQWDDWCNGTLHNLDPLPHSVEGSAEELGCSASSRGLQGCTPYAAPLPQGTDWHAVRKQLVNVLFGVEDGMLPTQSKPREVSRLNHSQVFGGCLCAIRGRCSPDDCSRSTSVTKLVWTIEVRVNASFTLALNATGFHSLNTSGIAPSNYPGGGAPDWPPEPVHPRSPGDTLVIFHNGHATPCSQQGCDPDYDGTVDWLNQLGYDTLALSMPLYQCNHVEGIPCKHDWFEQFEEQGAPVMRFFLEPVVLAVNYAREVLGYRRIVMAGLSGGGWTTTMAAAIDPRITLSFPVAGSMPCDFRHWSWDFEQLCNQKWAMVANYTSLYVLAGLEPDRYSIQVIHEADPCCFHTCHRHARIREYNAWVQSQISGRFATAATSGNVHEVNPRDKVIIASYIEKLRMQGRLTAADFATIPFNLVQQPEGGDEVSRFWL